MRFASLTTTLAALGAALLCLAPDCNSGSVGGGDQAATDADLTDTASRANNSIVDCQRRGSCSIKNGIPFSQSECETQNTTDGERADSVGCSAEFDAFLACAASGFDYDCTADVQYQLRAACGTQLDALTVCGNTPSGG